MNTRMIYQDSKVFLADDNTSSSVQTDLNGKAIELDDEKGYWLLTCRNTSPTTVSSSQNTELGPAHLVMFEMDGTDIKKNADGTVVTSEKDGKLAFETVTDAGGDVGINGEVYTLINKLLFIEAGSGTVYRLKDVSIYYVRADKEPIP